MYYIHGPPLYPRLFITEEKVERLPAQYHSTPCKVMQPGQLYSAERCVEQCTQRAIRQQCGCAVTFSCDGDDCNSDDSEVANTMPNTCKQQVTATAEITSLST